MKTRLLILTLTAFSMVHPTATQQQTAVIVPEFEQEEARESLWWTTLNNANSEEHQALVASLTGANKLANDDVPQQGINTTLDILEQVNFHSFAQFQTEFTQEFRDGLLGLMNMKLLSEQQIAQIKMLRPTLKTGYRFENVLGMRFTLGTVSKFDFYGLDQTNPQAETRRPQAIKKLKKHLKLSDADIAELSAWATTAGETVRNTGAHPDSLLDPEAVGNKCIRPFFHMFPSDDDREKCVLLISTLVSQLFDEVFEKLAQDEHPVKIAAYFYTKFIMIHPFFDGNGRTARLLTNIFLLDHGFQPFPFHEKPATLDIFRRYRVVEQNKMVADMQWLFYNHYNGIGTCKVCGKGPEKFGGGEKMKICSTCKNTRYCCRDCQQADWQRHKKQCTQNQS